MLSASLRIFSSLRVGDTAPVVKVILSAYFREVAPPSPFVLQALVWCLMGSGAGNQTLRFKPRNGRPPKKRETPLGGEAAAIQAFTMGDERALASYLDAGNVSNHVRRLLAEAFDSKDSTKQKLIFKRARAGNPATELRTILEKAFLGHTAGDLKRQMGATWPVVDDELSKLKLIRTDADDIPIADARKRAVSFVKRTRLESPQDYAAKLDQVERAFEALGMKFKKASAEKPS